MYRDAKTLKSCLTVELHREKVFSQSQEIAAVQTPLCYVNHSSQVGHTSCTNQYSMNCSVH